jgi:hypothetical protein
MKSNSFIQQHDTPFWARVTGFSETIYNRCLEGTQRSIRNLATAMMYTAALSAASFTAIVTFFYNPEDAFLQIFVGVLAFCGWFFMVVLFDKSVIAASRYGILSFFRLITVIAFAWLHAFVGAELFFNDDIQRELLVQKKLDMSNDDSMFFVQTEKVKHLIGEEHAKIDAATNTFKVEEARHTRIYQNMDGYSTKDNVRTKVLSDADRTFRNQKSTFQSDTARFNARILVFYKELASLNAAHTQLHKENSIDDLGFIHYLKSLKRIIFEKENDVLLLFWIVIFIIAFAIEGQPLFFKWNTSLEEYYTLEAMALKGNLDKHLKMELADIEAIDAPDNSKNIPINTAKSTVNLKNENLSLNN